MKRFQRSNKSHLAFIDTLQTARRMLSSREYEEQEAKADNFSKASAPLSKQEPVGPLEIVNKFEGLENEPLPSEDEVELEKLANGNKPSPEFFLPENAAPTRGRSKGKTRMVATEPLSSYKITSETEIYFAACFFIKDLNEVRRSVPSFQCKHYSS